ncbi:MAG: LD-carboxypeptidase [Lachnospiraceae bacterium]|nr:LD-carboxypeptidase [Lachnospiraceae bacterium]
MKSIIKPRCLNFGDTIGILAPSYRVNPEHIDAAICVLEEKGFRVKRSRYLYSTTSGYAGSIEERAEDFNNIIADPETDMLLFGGGEVSNELLPYIDYSAVAAHPKIICSYSDSTTILNAIHSATGLVVFYGMFPNSFTKLTDYNWQSFQRRLMSDDTSYTRNSTWRTICPGRCEGPLTGGYLINYASLLGLKYFHLEKDQSYVLFLEDHEQFSTPAMVSKWFSTLEHRGLFEHVSGLIFGHYSEKEFPAVDDVLRRIGQRYAIPVVHCEDFGHGVNNAVLPIGCQVRLDTEADTFEILESGVS